MGLSCSWSLWRAARALLLGGLAVATVPAWADVRPHRLFTDHMVLQRERPVTVWGWADAGEAVTVSFGERSVAATADAAGAWSVQLPAMEAQAAPQDLIIKGRNTVPLKDVVVGDVWLCSGQSNMAMSLGGCRAPEDIASARFPGIRCFNVPYIVADRPADDLRGPDRGRWTACSPETAAGFSGVAFYFGRRIHQETGVPIGLLVSSVGGTNIEKWMPREAFAGTPALEAIDKRISAAVDEYRKDVAASLPAIETWIGSARKALEATQVIPPAPDVPRHPVLPGSKAGGHWVHLYNGMIHPLGRFAVRGAIWYQGENNSGEVETYFEKKRAMIGAWRKLWGQDFPFYFVQLTSWRETTDDPSGGGRDWQHTRMGQLKCLAIPKTGMAVTIDIGEANDIHPRNKADVGERLALWALAKDYARTGLTFSGPLYREARVEGQSIRVHFDHAGSGLIVGTKDGRNPTAEQKGGKLRRFAIAGADKQWHWADAVIDGQTVVVSSPKVPAPVAVRYAFSMNPDGCNLYNREGLPASPFRTDDW